MTNIPHDRYMAATDTQEERAARRAWSPVNGAAVTTEKAKVETNFTFIAVAIVAAVVAGWIIG